MKQRFRRLSQRTRLPIESLEERVVPAATGSVSGFAFVDANGDGLRNFIDFNNSNTPDVGEDELLVKGTALRLTGTSTSGDTINAQVTTGSNGQFQFKVIPAGTYTLKADANAVVSGTLGTGVTFVVAEGESKIQDVPIDGVVVTGDLLLNYSAPLEELTSLEDYLLPTAGTGVSTGINEAPEIRADLQPEATTFSVDPTASTTSVDLIGIFTDPNIVTSQVLISTSRGDVNLNLLDDEAPQTVQNFYNYANSGAYDNSIFHRLVSGFVLQGGGFEYNSTAKTITAIPTDPAVKNEFDGENRSNVAGTVAMAKLGSGPDTATNQFFFNLGDNSANLDNQNGGFTVFGRLVGPDDEAVINSLTKTTSPSTVKLFDASNASGVNASVRGALDDLPLSSYANGVAKTTAEINATKTPSRPNGNVNDKTGATFSADTTAANFLQITGITTVVRDEVLTFSVVSNSNPGLFNTPDSLIKDNRLNLGFKPTASGTATIVVRATDKHGLTADVTFNVTAKHNPVFTSAASVNVPENTTDVLTVTATDADVPAQTVTFSIVGGADQSKFSITSGGVLTFVDPPDRENPTDTGLNNIYVVQVQANDGNGGTTNQTINVTVTGVNDFDPVFTTENTVDVEENTTAVLTVETTDDDLPNQTVTYSIVGGDDQDLFEITSDGVLSFKTAPDFENPTNAGVTPNVYAVEIQADDGDEGVTTQTISITVTDANDDPTFTTADAVSVEENTTAVLTVSASDEDLPAQTVTYSIVGGADQDLFEITNEGVLTFKAPPDFENPLDTPPTENVYVVQVQASDGVGGTSTQTLTVTVTAVNEFTPTITSNGGEATAAVNVEEGQTAVTTVIATDDDDDDTLVYSISGVDADFFDIDSETGELTFKVAPTFGSLADNDGNDIYEVTVKATDDGGLFDTQDISVTVIQSIPV